MRSDRPTFPDRISELNYVYGRAVFFSLFDQHDPNAYRLRHVSNAQCMDQARAGCRQGDRIRRDW